MAVGPHLSEHPNDLPSFTWTCRPHVFVAGGLSFVGRNLIAALLHAGYGVKSMARTIGERSHLRSLGCVSVTVGEPVSIEAVKSAAEGCLYAVHCASSFVHYDPSAVDIVRVANRRIAQAVVGACLALRITKLIVQSSEAVLFDGTPLRNVDESHPFPKQPLGTCAASMQELERYVLGSNSPELAIVVVRPRLLWGVGDLQFLPSLVLRGRLGNLRLVNRGDCLTSTCHVQNACEGIICAIRSAKGGQVYFLTDGEPLVFSEFVRGLLLACNVSNVDEMLSRSIPMWIARKVAKAAEVLGYAFGTQPVLTQSGIGLVAQEMTFVDDKARREIGYTSSTTREQGLSAIAQNPHRPTGSEHAD